MTVSEIALKYAPEALPGRVLALPIDEYTELKRELIEKSLKYARMEADALDTLGSVLTVSGVPVIWLRDIQAPEWR